MGSRAPNAQQRVSEAVSSFIRGGGEGHENSLDRSR
eukprot:SAG25_NODE_14560_length_253_cov_0.967532_1_plen_35_part_10